VLRCGFWREHIYISLSAVDNHWKSGGALILLDKEGMGKDANCNPLAGHLRLQEDFREGALILAKKLGPTSQDA
jgi:hypothetical protein